MTVYDENFFLELQEGARRSAREIVPLVLRLLHPRSVVDVGCGLGTWLAVFAESGVPDVLGIDGDYVNLQDLEIPKDRFLAHDLSKPLRLGRSFDLVLSLEVAEHLSEDHAATFVDTLTGLGGVVLFSAAIPFQGGTNHVNEQWPEYWAALFLRKGYAPVDCIRREVWRNESVDWWYAQNTLLFVEEDRLSRPPFAGRLERAPVSQLALVHPKQYLYAVEAAGLASSNADS
jgi:SAM-dependent methyltransferase